MWYNKWFNSPYYHLLYKNRDEDEAKLFINNLENYLQLTRGDKILDMPCGRGRHAIYLNKKGYNVTGIDLSKKNIKYANKFSNDTLSFYEHDMRNPFNINYYKYVLNLHTSFGYFDKDSDNIKVLKNAAQALVSGGKLIIDFMNTNKVIKNLVTSETIKIENILFDLKRNLKDGFIVKKISFKADGKQFEFYEKVKAFTKDTFLSYFNIVGLKLEKIFGDYGLNDYDKQNSDRMIFVCSKKYL